MSEVKKQKPKPTKPKLDPSWKVRRAVILFTIAFCCGVIVYITGWGSNNRLHETIASGMMFLMGSVVMAYSGFAVWDDKNKMVGKK